MNLCCPDESKIIKKTRKYSKIFTNLGEERNAFVAFVFPCLKKAVVYDWFKVLLFTEQLDTHQWVMIKLCKSSLFLSDLSRVASGTYSNLSIFV